LRKGNRAAAPLRTTTCFGSSWRNVMCARVR
jgi:hypothetical protein